MQMRFAILGMAVVMAACGGGRGPVTVPGLTGVAIPRAVAAQLSDRFGTWQIVGPGAEAAQCASRFSDPPGPIASGDFNGDGATDIAFQVAANGARHVVAAFARLDGEYVLAEVTAAPEAGGVLGVERKAAPYRHDADGLVFYYSLDTISFGPCGQPQMAYFWGGTSFQARPVFE